MKQTELQWLENQHQSDGGNLNKVRSERTRIFREKKMEYLEEKINEFETKRRTNMSETRRGINEFKEVFQPRTNIAKMRMVICLRIPTVFEQVEELLPSAIECAWR
jgi:type IV secretory pathway VirB4 component